MAVTSLLTTTSRVEAPYIGVKIGEYTFGVYNKSTIQSHGSKNISKLYYPNYVKSLEVVKVNGAVNTYSLTMIYVVRPGDDPNFLDKVLSSISDTWTMYISYGDMASPAFVFREEEVVVNKINRSIDINSSCLTYRISATSTSMSLLAGNYTFPKRVDKPSEVITELLRNKTLGLSDVYYGMKDIDLVKQKGLISGTDQAVTIEAQKSVTVLQYLNYLVSCMVPKGAPSSSIKQSSRYVFTTHDDINNSLGGPYFKVTEVPSVIKENNSYDAFEIDVGYPGSTPVISLSIEDNNAYSILYDYSQKIDQSDYVYRIDEDGNYVSQYSPMLTSSGSLMKTTEADKVWWSSVTQYPIKATITIKGLLRPATLMEYVKLNVYFYGQKHNITGTYIVTKQQDIIDGSGYRTTLSLVKIAGES